MNVAKQYHICGRGSTEIAESLEAAIRENRLAAGARIPTVRALAASLGVSLVTVATAYRTLRERGLLMTDGRRGTTVRGAPPLLGRPVLRFPEGVRNLADGNPDPALLPSLRKTLATRAYEPVLYGEEPEIPELLELAAKRFASAGVPWTAIAIVGGALDGIERVLAASLRPGDRVAVEDPAYPAYLDVLAALGLVAEPVAIDGSGFVPAALRAALESGVRAAIYAPRSQNPTGAAFDRERAAALHRVVAKRPEVLLVEDDHTAGIAGAPFFTLVADRAKFAVVRSVSKTLGPDLRLAFLSGDPMTVARVRSRQRVGTGWVSRMLQSAVLALWSDPAVKEQVERAREVYAQRRDAFVRALAAEGIIVQARSGLNVWVPVVDEEAMVRSLLEAGWGVNPGSRFRIAGGPAIRVTIARLEPNDAVELARAISAASCPTAYARTT
ncbi:MAG: aminotransferase class I/II-fold pyridoxal phosphate-dependent enzyme [bacterium]|nr:aminotransferase class I/II-fold pyridoxal phosphate-dependent enzyme [bacterium]